MIEVLEQNIRKREAKKVASVLRGSPKMEKLLFEEALDPHLQKLESLGTPDVDVDNQYLLQTSFFLKGSSTERAMQTSVLNSLRTEELKADVEYAL